MNIIKLDKSNFHEFNKDIEKIIKNYLERLQQFDYIIAPTNNNVKFIMDGIVARMGFNLTLFNLNDNNIITDLILCMPVDYNGLEVTRRELGVFMQWSNEFHVRGISDIFFDKIKLYAEGHFDVLTTMVHVNNIGKQISIEGMSDAQKEYFVYKHKL